MILTVDKYGGWLSKPGARPNQNQVLFLVCQLWEMHLAGVDVVQGLAHWNHFMDATYLGGGRFSRRPKDKMMNSHDNYTGMAAGCLLWSVVHGKNSPWEAKLLALGKRGWNYSGTHPLRLKTYLRGQLKPNDIAFIKACCSGKTGGLGRKMIELNAKSSDSWNLHRLRGICLERIKGGQAVADILKKRMNYGRAIADYYGKGSVIFQAYQANGGRW